MLTISHQDPREPNPEQTVPLLSLVTHTYIGRVVWLANQLPHLPYDKLPPLADYDYLKNLVGKVFPVRRVPAC